ncbi:MAG: hypothetical protein ACTTJG_08790 [Treponema sp.]
MAVSINSAYSYNPHSAGTKLYVPVSSSSLLYSHFDHVQGFAAGKGQNGISISKLKILNTLIDHLSSIKSGNAKPTLKSTSPEEIDALIENYQTQISQAVKAAEEMPYIIAGNRPEAGVLFSFTA